MSTQQHGANYRPDIDGLRALAVVAVILYHAEVPGFAGGYVGVDIFFVISGYLITRLLAGTGARPLRMLWSEFYLRRARRILPALLLTSLVVTALAVIMLMPYDLTRFGKYLTASSLFLSNVPEWREGGGYLNSRNAYVVITHFWSIAVEEQFYLVYPLALFLIGTFVPHRRTAALLVLAGSSLALCVWASYRQPLANFYLAPTRAWELLVGAVIAGNEAPWFRRQPVNDTLALAALLSLAAVIHWYGSMTRFPGLTTVLPCAAVAVLIVTGQSQSSIVSRCLAAPPLVFTGLISYSLYLWHLPALMFFSYYSIRPLGPMTLIGLLAAVYLLAVLSWRLVETPVRARSWLRSNRAFLWVAGASNAIILAAGIVLWTSNGFPQRFPADFRVPDQAWMASRGSFAKCVNRPVNTIAQGGLCSDGPQDNAAPRALVWGDSHAMALLPAYRRLAAAHGVRVYFALKAGCRPLLDMTNRSYDADWQAGCLAFNAAVARAIGIIRPRVVILNAHWIDADADLGPVPSIAADALHSNFGRGLQHTVGEILAAGAAACVVLDVPAYKYDLPYALNMAGFRGIGVDFLTLSRTEAMAQYRAPERDFRALEQRGMLRTVDPKDLMCSSDSCVYQVNGELLYSDWDHLSARGALFVSGAIEGCLRDITAPDAKL
jgi:peptidoglycan/LPS O-acetylase OafA/YrhL